jgi:hypothetical protein
VSRTKSLSGLAAVILGATIIYCLLPLGTALQFGGDEGYQLNTAFLMSKGFVLYKQIWNDQPPVLVLLLEWAFRVFGPSILAARLIAAGSGLLMLATFYQVVKLRSGQWPALVAAFFLLASPGILELSVSVMQEVPTFALALVSVLLLLRWRERHGWRWLASSGVVMGVALGTKLTAVVAVPAMVMEMLLSARAKNGSLWSKNFFISVLQWGAAVGMSFMCIMFLWGQGSFQSSYRSHFAEHSVYGLPSPQDVPIPLSLFVDHGECVVATVIGIVLAIRRRRMHELAFPCVWLATAVVIHSVHRPWWMYYYLHLAIPMAWLTGFAVCELSRPFCMLFANAGLRLSSAGTWKALALCTLAAVALVRSERRVEGGVKGLQARTRVNANPVLAKMKEYAKKTHWVYVQDTKEAYAFHARLAMPPELAVVTAKRFWSDQISISEIVDTCRRYKPEQVLLNPDQITGEWTDFLAGYSVGYQDKDALLYVLCGEKNEPATGTFTR